MTKTTRIHSRTLRPALAILLASLAAACTTTAPTANVVRFHEANVPTSGTLAVQPALASQSDTLEHQVQGQAVADAFRSHGFTMAAQGAAPDLVATYSVSTMSRDGEPKRSGLSIGLGGGFGGRNAGVGGSVAVPIGTRTSGDTIVQTMLRVQLRQKAANGPIVWEGRASAEGRADKTTGEPAMVVPALAKALLAGFPGHSAETVRVPLER